MAENELKFSKNLFEANLQILLKTILPLGTCNTISNNLASTEIVKDNFILRVNKYLAIIILTKKLRSLLPNFKSFQIFSKFYI